jgi:NAD+ synthase
MGLRISLDAEEAAKVLESFVREYVATSGAAGAILGVSGGLDSAVVAHLAVRALGREKVLALILPEHGGPNRDAAEAKPPLARGTALPSRDVAHALLVADQLDIERRVVPIGPIVEKVEEGVGELPRGPRGNAKARARMVTLYAEANRANRIVLGTGNKSELLTGYFTKHGDGGVDLQPIGDLYKTQVRILAEHYGVPEVIRHKPPTAGLWDGQTDEDELGMTYDKLDRVLLGLEVQMPAETVAKEVGVPVAEVQRIERMRRASQHKRRTPMVPRMGIRTVGLDWRASVGEGGDA